MNVDQAYIGMKIFADNKPDCSIEANHDIIYGPYRDDMLLSIAEAEALEEAGWHVDSEFKCWAHFC